MNFLKKYNDSLKSGVVTRMERNILVICFSIGSIVALASAGLFLYILPKIFSGTFVLEFMSKTFSEIFFVVFMVFLIFLSISLGYTAYIISHREVIK
jgi:hypothetical protein